MKLSKRPTLLVVATYWICCYCTTADEQTHEEADNNVDLYETTALTRTTEETETPSDGTNHEPSHHDAETFKLKSSAVSLHDSPENNEETGMMNTNTLPLVNAVQTVGPAVFHAAQRILHDEILPRFPAHLSDMFYGHNGEHEEYDNGIYIWRPQDDLYTTSSAAAASYHNHVVIQPPLRPFFTSEDVRLSMERLTEANKQQIRKRHGRNKVCNNTKFERMTNSSSFGHLTQPGNNATTQEEPKDNDSFSAVVHSDANATVNTNTTLVNYSSTTSDTTSHAAHGKEEEQQQEESVLVDYASKSAGAVVIEKSAGWKGTSNLLTSDTDQYAIVPTALENKSLIIGLSEEILVKKIVLSNYERYSSNVKEFQLLGSQTMGNWADLGFYTAKSNKFGQQEFELQDSAKWARYLRFRIISHYGDEHFLTITQISAHGATMQQGFHEQWEEQQQTDDLDDAIDGTDQEESKTSVVDNSTTNSNSSQSISQTNSSLENMTGDVSTTNGGNISLGSGVVSIQLISSAEFEIDHIADANCSSCKVRGVGSNGYLLFDWILPPSIETDCQWTALASASVAANSTARMRITASPDDSTCTKEITILPFELPRFLISKSSSDSKAGYHFIARNAIILSRTSSALSSSVSHLLDSIEKEIGQRLHLNESKINFFRYAWTVLGKKNETNVNVTIVEENDTINTVILVEENKTNTADIEVVSKTSVVEPTPDPKATRDQHLLGEILDNPVMEILVSRIPSATCLKQLNLTQYKAKSTQARSSTTGTTNSNPSTGGMEPVFKKLTAEIKALQTSLTVHEKFARDSVSCFQRVLLDIMVEQEKEREIANKRLENIERYLNGEFLYHAFLDILSTFWNILYQVTENLVLQLSLMPWSEVIAWVFENPLRSSTVGFPLSIICMLFYRRRRRIRTKYSS